MANSVEKNLFSEEKLNKTGTTLAIAMGGLALAGCGSEEAVGHGDTVEHAVAVELSGNDARLRGEPNVAKTDVHPGHVLYTYSAEDPLTVEVTGDVYEKDTYGNGVWYGIPEEDLAAAIPDFPSERDSDGIIWVNHQRASVIEEPREALED